MLFLRMTGKLFLTVGFIILAYDGLRMLATPGEGAGLSSLEAVLKMVLPTLNASGDPGLPQPLSDLWGYLIEPLLRLPAAFVLGGAGGLLYMLGFRRPPLQVLKD